MEQRWISPEQAAELLGFTPRQVRDWVKEGEIPGARIGGRYRIDRRRLEEQLEERALVKAGS